MKNKFDEYQYEEENVIFYPEDKFLLIKEEDSSWWIFKRTFHKYECVDILDTSDKIMAFNNGWLRFK